MKTTIDLADEVFRQAQEQAAQRGLDLSQFLSAAVTKLVQASQPLAPNESGRRAEFPIIKDKGGVLRITAEEIAEIEGREEAEYYARCMRN